MIYATARGVIRSKIKVGSGSHSLCLGRFTTVQLTQLTKHPAQTLTVSDNDQ